MNNCRGVAVGSATQRSFGFQDKSAFSPKRPALVPTNSQPCPTEEVNPRLLLAGRSCGRCLRHLIMRYKRTAMWMGASLVGGGRGCGEGIQTMWAWWVALWTS